MSADPFASITAADIVAAIQARARRVELSDRYRLAENNSSEHWQAIRDAWAPHYEAIAAGERRDPYFLDWKFTPIESNAWGDIRGIGVPLYPQCPVAGVFIDFADPHLKIGLELDGKDFHDVERDRTRDERLWTFGWRIFRVSGAESFRMKPGPLDESFHDEEESERRYLLNEWARTTIEGVIWALGFAYYNKRHRASSDDDGIAFSALDRHRLADFPLEMDEP